MVLYQYNPGIKPDLAKKSFTGTNLPDICLNPTHCHQSPIKALLGAKLLYNLFSISHLRSHSATHRLTH